MLRTSYFTSIIPQKEKTDHLKSSMALPSFFFWIILVQFCNGQNYPKFPAILVFGDSVFDTGNNNYINTIFKGDFRPYGINFPGGIPTGRFSDGKLVPDILASLLRIKETVPPFLQPNLSDDELRTGVCFASAGAGLDNQTNSLSGVVPVLRQPEYLKDYIKRLERIAGEQEAHRIIREALVIINAGIVDFMYNFYLMPTNRKLEFTVSEYQDVLQKNLQKLLKELYDLGCRKMVVSGLPPFGCLPLALTEYLSLERNCIEYMNIEVQAYNQKLVKLLPQVEEKLPGSKIPYADIYNPLVDMINNPKKYGFVETKRGCCGTGLIEIGQLCNPLIPVCKNPSQFLFWDSTHPTEATYRYLSKKFAKEILPIFLEDDSP